MLSRIALVVLTFLGLLAGPAVAQNAGSAHKYKDQSAVADYLSNPNLNESVRFVIANTLFTLYHETGHLLVDQLDWPIIGREEDVADNFATYALLGGKRRGYELALKDSALGWQLNDETYGGRREASDYYDEHSLDLQRAYQIVCLLVGNDRRTFAVTAQEWGMDRERQYRCQGDYEQIENSISRLLAAHAGATFETEVTVTYDRPDRDMALAYKVLRDSRLLESLADDLKQGYGLPRPVSIRGTMCGQPNAFYDGEEIEILMCYELLDDFFYMYDTHASR